MRRCLIIFFIVSICINSSFLYSIEKFYTYYDKALKYMHYGTKTLDVKKIHRKIFCHKFITRTQET